MWRLVPRCWGGCSGPELAERVETSMSSESGFLLGRVQVVGQELGYLAGSIGWE